MQRAKGAEFVLPVVIGTCAFYLGKKVRSFSMLLDLKTMHGLCDCNAALTCCRPRPHADRKFPKKLVLLHIHCLCKSRPIRSRPPATVCYSLCFAARYK